MPTYDELIELSNGELTKCIRIAKDGVDKMRHDHQSTTEKQLIYRAYDNERLKRLKLARK
jgi:hypothetical protein